MLKSLNIIPDTAVLQGTLRTNDTASREKLVRRLKEAVQKTAELFGGLAEVEMISEVPPLVCDSAMTDEIAGYIDERGDAPAHNPKVRFNEDVCPIGSACLAHCAVRWLEEHP